MAHRDNDMNKQPPPRLLEAALSAILSGSRDAESITGDLLEMYCERAESNGRARATFWYARQIVSLAPRAAGAHPAPRTLLVMVCAFTALAGGWLGTMDLLLHHSNIAQHEAIAGTIVGQALITLALLHFRTRLFARLCILPGLAGILYLSGVALNGLIHALDFEGYILLIGLALAVQGLLTLLVFFAPNPAEGNRRASA